MAEGNPLANVPPWVYLVVLLGGGGTLGGLQMGGGSAPVVAQPQPLDLRADECRHVWVLTVVRLLALPDG